MRCISVERVLGTARRVVHGGSALLGSRCLPARTRIESEATGRHPRRDCADEIRRLARVIATIRADSCEPSPDEAYQLWLGGAGLQLRGDDMLPSGHPRPRTCPTDCRTKSVRFISMRAPIG